MNRIEYILELENGNYQKFNMTGLKRFIHKMEIGEEVRVRKVEVPKDVKRCPYCKKEFETISKKRVFCNHYCRNRFYVIKNRKHSELFKMDEHDQNIWYEYHGIEKE